ncbi:MAG: phage exclusion protein Lit family protein [Stenotrophomonas lactitubi]|uniref:phage exclusion protein Lit family protein n=1 Tax=Stenotrophomonas lactitubi TaxID=2045214 RepID=UPI003D13E537
MTEDLSLRSPVLIFASQIAGSAFAVAPEREEELLAAAPTFSLALSNDRGFYIRVNMSTHEATLPIATLEYLWACAYLFWVLYQEYVAAQERGDELLDLSDRRYVRGAIDAFNWTRNNQAVSGVESWPQTLPRPTRMDGDSAVSAANELFLMAIAWIIHHEIAHVRADHSALHRTYAVKQELEADEMATDWILGKCDDPGLRKKRQLGMVTALLAMQLLDEPPGADTYVSTHPPTVERLYACLERARVDDDGAPRAFAAIALQLQLSQYELSIPLDGSSIQDILGGAMIEFHTSLRTP